MDFRQELFNILKGFGFKMKMYDVDGNGPLISPLESAYLYAIKKNERYMIHIDDISATDYSKLIIYKTDLKNEYAVEFRDLLERLKKLALKNKFIISVKNFGRNFAPKDFSDLPQQSKIYNKQHEELTETFDITGTKFTSKHVSENARVVVRHKKAVDESSHNSRSRNIKDVYVVSKNGDRRRIDNNSLLTGKAVANYVNGGGNLYDDNTNKLILLSSDYATLRNRYLEENACVIDEDMRDYVNDLMIESRKKIKSYLTKVSQRKIAGVEDSLSEMASPSYTFKKTYFEGLVNNEPLAEALARASFLK